jgi:hypothetical protein
MRGGLEAQWDTIRSERKKKRIDPKPIRMYTAPKDSSPRWEDAMPFAFLMTHYMKRLEAGDPGAVAVRDGAQSLWRKIVPYLINYHGREWWEVGFHQTDGSRTAQ